MQTRLSPGLGLAIAGLVCAPAASAATLQYTQDFGPTASTGGGWSEPVTIPFFDTADGTLTRIRITWDCTVTDSLFVQAPSFSSFSGQVGTRAGVGIVDIFSATLGSGVFAQTSYTVSLAPDESTSVGGSKTGQRGWVLNPGDPGFQPFGVLGATLFSSSIDGMIGGVGFVGTMPIGDNTTGGRLTIAYDFTPVPEAGTTGAIATALALAGLATANALRRRKSAT